MTVKEIVRLVATLLGKENVEKFLDGESGNFGDAERETDVICRCINMVINELACCYLPMVKKEKVTSLDGKIFFPTLSEQAVEIISVKNPYNEEIAYKIYPERLEVGESECVLEYRYLPANYDLEDTIGYEDKVPQRLIAYGTAAEVCLTERAFDESVMWRKRFTDTLTELVKPKNVILQKRRWA